MIFLFPVPLWFVLLGLAGSLAFTIYDLLEDASVGANERWRRTRPHPPGALDDLSERIERQLNAYKIAEAERLLKRLAENCK
jgi:hypothetical protein